MEEVEEGVEVEKEKEEEEEQVEEEEVEECLWKTTAVEGCVLCLCWVGGGPMRRRTCVWTED